MDDVVWQKKLQDEIRTKLPEGTVREVCDDIVVTKTCVVTALGFDQDFLANIMRETVARAIVILDGHLQELTKAVGKMGQAGDKKRAGLARLMRRAVREPGE